MTFDKTLAGYNYTASDDDATIYKLLSSGDFGGWAGSSDFTENKVTVTLTGWQTVSNRGNKMSQIITGDWVNLSEGWTKTGTMTQYSAASAQKYVDDIINANKLILCNNLLCARFSNKLTKAEKQTVYDLQTRLNKRNDSLINDGMLTSVQTATPTGYTELEAWLTEFMNNGVGVVVTTGAIIAISAVVIASLATAAYFAYRAYAAEATSDVKFSDDLTKKLLSRLTEDEYKQLMKETKGLVTKASLKARFSNTFNIAKLALCGVGVFTLYWILKTYNDSKDE